MAYFFFIDESGQDQRESPYEVLAAVAIEDIKLWPLIQELHNTEEEIFGLRYKKFGNELKAKKLLNKKTFRLSSQMDPIDSELRKQAARRCILNGALAGKLELTALAQAKIAYVHRCLELCSEFKCLFLLP